jgi:primase-polymerase (primpol)-like protein
MSSYRHDAGQDKAGRPQALAVRPDDIPPELRQLAQWVVWKYVPEVDPETGETNWDKPPRRPDGRLASSTNPQTWSPYETALAAYQAGGLDGLGIALDGRENADGLVLVAVDLDHCTDRLSGRTEPWAQAIIDAIRSYSEISPSGTGIRIFLWARPLARGRKRGPKECYCRGRYVTVTGHHIGGTPRTVEARPEALLAFLAEHFPEPARCEPRPQGGGVPADLDDAEVVRLLGEAHNGGKFKALWAGNVDGYASRSEADLALCSLLRFRCGRDPDRIDALFRQSGLFRSKWLRDSYREPTLSKALDGPVYGENGHRGGRPRGWLLADRPRPARRGFVRFSVEVG